MVIKNIHSSTIKTAKTLLRSSSLLTRSQAFKAHYHNFSFLQQKTISLSIKLLSYAYPTLISDHHNNHNNNNNNNDDNNTERGALEVPPLTNSKLLPKIARYLPQGSEFPISNLINYWETFGCEVLTPRRNPSCDYFHFNLQNNNTTCKAVPDVLLVPVVAYDESGAFLGMGDGVYDRTIRKLRESYKKQVMNEYQEGVINSISRINELPVLIVGMAFQQQKTIDSIPMDTHDEYLDCLINETDSIELFNYS